jgi:hypothetical protein
VTIAVLSVITLVCAGFIWFVALGGHCSQPFFAPRGMSYTNAMADECEARRGEDR